MAGFTNNSPEKVWVVTLVKNEQDIIGYTLSHWLSQGVDGIVVADNMSTDGTWDILAALKEHAKIPIVLIYDEEPAHYQSKKVTEMMRYAGIVEGADIVIPCDADELWYSDDPKETVADRLRASVNKVFGIQMWNHFCTSRDAESDNPFIRMCWKNKERNPLDKVAVRFQQSFVIDEGNHRVLSYGTPVAGSWVGVSIRHLPYRSADHFISKAIQGGTALALAKGIPETVGAHWRQYKASIDEHGAEAVKEHYKKYFTFPDPTELMVEDPAPYQGVIYENLCGNGPTH